MRTSGAANHPVWWREGGHHRARVRLLVLGRVEAVGLKVRFPDSSRWT